MRIKKKPMKVKSAEEIMEAPEGTMEDQDVEVAPEATELLFETEDVAQLLAEVTDSEVTVDVDDEADQIVFTVDGDEYAVEPEGTEEILEASRKVLRGKKSVKASTARRKIAGAKRNVRRR